MNDKETSGIIYDLKRFALHDGPGIRLTVFMKGCPLNCWWCHNPEGIDSGMQTVPRESRVGNRVVHLNEEIGRPFSVDDLIQELEKERIFFDESGGGVTFSGGEPLLQIDFLEKALKRCKALEFHTVLDTCGHASFDKFERILEHLDLILYDLKIMAPAKHKEYTGVSNQLILENLQRLTEADVKLKIRLPVIPGFTDTDDNIAAIVSFLQSLKNTNEVDLLPFHNTATGKYQRLQLPNRLQEVPSMTTEELHSISKVFKNHDFNVHNGG